MGIVEGDSLSHVARPVEDAQSGGLECARQDFENVVCLAVAGNLDLGTVASFRARVKAVVGQRDALVLDLSGLRHTDSSGIHALLDACQMWTLPGRRMVLAAVPPHIQRVLEVFAADDILPCFDTVEAAVQATARPCHGVPVAAETNLPTRSPTTR